MLIELGVMQQRHEAVLEVMGGLPVTEVAARYVAIQEQLVHRGLALAALALDKRGAWSLSLSNGIQVRLGSQDVDVRLARFFEALDSVVAAVAADVSYIDMRYTNGFAVGWKHQRAAGEKLPNV